MNTAADRAMIITIMREGGASIGGCPGRSGSAAHPINAMASPTMSAWGRAVVACATTTGEDDPD